MKPFGKLTQRLPALLERYKYPLLILLLGVGLLLLPVGGERDEKTPAPTETTERIEDAEDGAEYVERTERELERLLSQIDGAGRVEVMLTLRSGPSARYQTDRSLRRDEEVDRSSSDSEERTVMLERNGAYTVPLIVNTEYPAFQGALIVAEGGADPSVRCMLTEAVAALLGLVSDRITVVKMKERG